MNMEDGDVSDNMRVHMEDLDDQRFQICWSCKDRYRPDQPTRIDHQLSNGNRYLTVKLNDIIYFSDELPGVAKRVHPKIKPTRKCDKVYVVIEKQESGMWL